MSWVPIPLTLLRHLDRSSVLLFSKGCLPPKLVPVYRSYRYCHGLGLVLLAPGWSLQVFAGLMKMSLVSPGNCHRSSEMENFVLFSWFVFFGVFSSLPSLMWSFLLQSPASKLYLTSEPTLWLSTLKLYYKVTSDVHGQLAMQFTSFLFAFLTECKWKHLASFHAVSAKNRPCFFFFYCCPFVAGTLKVFFFPQYYKWKVGPKSLGF